jgi:aryl-alcohol dehydrogenase-like predicted oxidoreductase
VGDLDSVLVDMRTLGTTGLSVSPILLGCGSIGGIGSPASTRGKGLSPAEGMALIDAAVDAGVNVLDTANSYAGGVSEQVVGTWLADHAQADVLIATKVGNLVEPDQTDTDLSLAHVTRQAQASLARLGRIDLYLSHSPDDSTPIEETLEAFAALLESGTVRAIGACNIDSDQLEHALDVAQRRGLPCYQWVQNEYNLLARDDEQQLFELVRDHQLGYTPYSPLAGGILSGRYTPGAAPSADSRMAIAPLAMRPIDDETWNGLRNLAAHAEQRGVTTAALALAWVMTAPHVTAPLVAPRDAAQLAAILDALMVDLDDDERAEIAEYFDSTPSP